MEQKTKYRGDDLAAVVWPRQSAPFVRRDKMTWEDAAREAWAMDSSKADRVKILIAVHEDVIQGAWAVTRATHHAAIPEGKTRMVSRSEFHTKEDSRLAYLVGVPSPLTRRRNPQATLELRDLPGGDVLVSAAEPATHGVAQLGQFALLVSEDGHAELRMPPGAVLTVRTAQ